MNNPGTVVDIKRFLPHRPPMLMSDRLLEITEDRAVGDFYIAPDCVFAQNGKLSETGLIEHAAQICSAIIGQRYFFPVGKRKNADRVHGYISTIKDIQICGLPQTGNTVVTHVTLETHSDMGVFDLCAVRAKCRVGDSVLLTGAFHFLISESV